MTTVRQVSLDTVTTVRQVSLDTVTTVGQVSLDTVTAVGQVSLDTVTTVGQVSLAMWILDLPLVYNFDINVFFITAAPRVNVVSIFNTSVIIQQCITVVMTSDLEKSLPFFSQTTT